MSGLGMNAEISENLNKLTKANSKLDRMLAKIGTKADNGDFRAALSKERNQAKRLCKTLMKQLKEGQSGDGDKQMLSGFSRQFKGQLDKFTESSQSIEKREREVVIAIGSCREDESPIGGDTTRTSMSREQTAASMQVDIQFLEYDVEEIRRREEGIRNIEQDVLEVAEMFTDLNLLVNEQQETLDLISDNISAAKTKTEGAANELVKAEGYQTKSRKKMCCLLLLVMIVLLGIVLGVTVVSK